ncbi:MAG: diguanylate cyclase [Gemmataceae bacterium]|nr:diguanylate cyclase [Gemmataceae bacterium]
MQTTTRTTAHLPSNLTLLRPATTGDRAPAPAPPRLPRLLSRAEVFERLETVGVLAPRAPLSFLVVRVDRAGAAHQLLLQAMTRRIQELIRPTDTLGQFTGSSFAVVLQGTGATAAGAVAARLTHHLNQLAASLSSGARVEVYAATGTGLNADTLPVAALDSLDDCC